MVSIDTYRIFFFFIKVKDTTSTANTSDMRRAIVPSSAEDVDIEKQQFLKVLDLVLAFFLRAIIRALSLPL